MCWLVYLLVSVCGGSLLHLLAGLCVDYMVSRLIYIFIY